METMEMLRQILKDYNHTDLDGTELGSIPCPCLEFFYDTPEGDQAISLYATPLKVSDGLELIYNFYDLIQFKLDPMIGKPDSSNVFALQLNFGLEPFPELWLIQLSSTLETDEVSI